MPERTETRSCATLEPTSDIEVLVHDRTEDPGDSRSSEGEANTDHPGPHGGGEKEDQSAPTQVGGR